jgi:hypothetical protein
LPGLAVSVVPGIEAVRLPPQVVFFGFLPPLLYAAAFLTAPREVRANWLSILLLAVGLTAATLFAIAGVAWVAVAALGAGGALLLGSVLGPTDPVSATAVIGRSSAPEERTEKDDPRQPHQHWPERAKRQHRQKNFDDPDGEPQRCCGRHRPILVSVRAAAIGSPFGRCRSAYRASAN